MSDSNAPQYFNDENKALWEALDYYFAHAGEDSKENIRIAKPYIDRLGNAIIIAGFSWVAERIEKEGLDTIKLALFTSGELLNLRTFIIAEKSFSQLRDIVSTLGNEAGNFLVANITTGADEDEQALAACMLANDFLSTLEPLQLEFARNLLKGFYDEAEGTSYKMALAWALYKMGDKIFWETLVYGEFFIKREFIQLVEQMAKIAEPGLGNKEIKDLVCRNVASGEYPGLPIPISEIGKRGLFRTLALDIASDGKAYQNAPHWSRKPKRK